MEMKLYDLIRRWSIDCNINITAGQGQLLVALIEEALNRRAPAPDEKPNLYGKDFENMKTVNYYCMLVNPVPAQGVIYAIEGAEKQGWEAAHVLFCGHIPVSSLDVKHQAAAPVYTVIFRKAGEIGKRPSLLDIKKPEIPPTEMPQKKDDGIADALDGRR